MLVKTEAIVLNKIKYSDNSFIVNLYSESEGKISILTRISQRKHDGKANIFLPLNIVLTEFKV
ncbi:MAG: recombination protein O N-terminal domain-containing protein, partial [Bacteroidales bacterium]|nr:recombination protein O N-terminal domain-containing protein [Bacteroidales bacterium]